MRYRSFRFVLCMMVAVAFLLAGSLASAAEHAFVGSKACKKCHIKEFNSWAETKMAKTFEVLKPGAAAEAKTAAKLDPKKDYSADPACVGCHVTGFGKKGGFVDFAKTPDLVGVGCESCHGAGADYMTDTAMSLKNKEYKKADLIPLGLVSPPTKETCVACHNEKSPTGKGAFDFEANKKKGAHEIVPLKYKH